MALSDPIRDYVRKRADYRCEYCQTSELLSSIKCEIDHIIPQSKQGSSELDNLCAACTFCNGRKYNKTEGIDPITGKKAQLFNPREQAWSEHFQWSEDGTIIVGLTPCGRATANTLDFNDPLRVSSRSVWALTKYHPP